MQLLNVEVSGNYAGFFMQNVTFTVLRILRDLLPDSNFTIIHLTDIFDRRDFCVLF